MAPATESTSLLSGSRDEEDDAQDSMYDSHDALFQHLDSSHDHDHIHDHPPDAHLHKVKSHLATASSPSGHGHPIHHHLQSPALILRLQQSFEHGFHTVWSAIGDKLSRKPSLPSLADRRTHVIHMIFFIAVLTMLAMTSISPTLLLFMNENSFTDANRIGPYVTASALSTAVPVVSNIVITSLSTSASPAIALCVGALVSALGMVILIIFRSSLWLFFIGYALYSASNSLRVVRISLISLVIPPKDRTTILATHSLMTPIGALMGPLVWLVLQKYRGSITFLGVLFDRFSFTYVVTIIAFVLIAIISVTTLKDLPIYHHRRPNQSGGDEEEEEEALAEHASSHSQHPAHAPHLHSAVLHFADGHDQTVDLQRYRNRVFTYFCLVWLGVNLSAGFYMTSFQPILVNEFSVTDAKLGFIFELIAAFAVVPPLLVALLSKWLMDRHILVIGLCSKLIGMILFQPIFGGATKEWQIILGFLLIIKASIFFSTSAMSLFTKLLGPMGTGAVLGLLASGSSVVPAIVQIGLSDRIVLWFDSWKFGMFGLPAVVSLIAIVWPSMWKRLDPSREFTQLVTSEAELQQAGEA